MMTLSRISTTARFAALPLLASLAAAETQYQTNDGSIYASIDGASSDGSKPISIVNWVGEASTIYLEAPEPGATTFLLLSDQAPISRDQGATVTAGGQLLNLEADTMQMVDMSAQFAASSYLEIPVQWTTTGALTFQLLSFSSSNPDGYILSAVNTLHYHNKSGEHFSFDGSSPDDLQGIPFVILDYPQFEYARLDDLSSEQGLAPQYAGLVQGKFGERVVFEAKLELDAVEGILSLDDGTKIDSLGDFIPASVPAMDGIVIEVKLDVPITFDAALADVVMLAHAWVTSKGCVIPAVCDGRPGKRDVTQAQANAILAGLGLANPPQQVGGPTDTYNCHGFTFTCGAKWIDNKHVPKILADNNYIGKADNAPKMPGDIIVYFDNNGGVVHTGVVVQVDPMGNPTLIESKWGASARYLHGPNDVPPSYTNPGYFCNGGNNKLDRKF